MWCTASSTFNNCTLCPHCICVFCIYLRTNGDLCHLHHKLIGFYNRDEKRLLRGANWVFKYGSLHLIFNGLNGQRVWYMRNIDSLRKPNMAYNFNSTVHIYQKIAHTWPMKHKMNSTEIHFIDNNSACTEGIPVLSTHCSCSGLRFSPLNAVCDILARTFPTQQTFFKKSSNSFSSILRFFKVLIHIF